MIEWMYKGTNMPRLDYLKVAAFSALSFLVATSDVFAQDGKSAAAREAAVKQCIAKMYAEHPRTGSGDELDNARVAFFKSCMTGLGFAP